MARQRAFAVFGRLLPLGGLLLLVACDGALLNRPKRKPSAQRDYGLLGNMVVKGLDAAFGIMRNATAPSPAPCQNISLATGHGTAVVNVTAEAEIASSLPPPVVGKRRTPALPPCPSNNAAEEKKVEPSIVEQAKADGAPSTPNSSEFVQVKPPEPPRWQRSADRFRKLVEPFLLNFRSPEEHITEAIKRLKGLEATERLPNPRYIGGFSEL